MKYINKEYFSKIKGKLKLFKDKAWKKIAVLSLATVLLVSGCSVKQSSNPVVSNNSNNYYTEQQESSVTFEEIVEEPSSPIVDSSKEPVVVRSDLTDEELAFLNQNVSIDQNSYNAFVSYIHGIDVEYENSQYFQVAQALQKYQSIQEYETVSSNFIQNGKINETALKQRVIENNSAYFNGKTSGKYSELDTATFNKVFSYLMEAINYQLESGTDIDLGQLDDKLSNLKIFRMTSQGSGSTSDDGIVAVNLEDIAVRQQNYPNVDYLRMTVLHEGNHLIQVSSVKEAENEGYTRNLGIAYSWDDLAVNPLFYKWYVESSAEYLKNYQYGEGSVTSTYENHVKSLEMLTLTTLLKENVNATTLAQISLQSDLNKLFEIFNCQTDKEKVEVINMMYAMEICLNQPTEFSKFYKEQTGTTLNTYAYQNSLEASIGQTLTKNFYENLAEYTLKNNQSLKEVFSIMATFELEMSRFTWFSSESCYEDNATFIKDYQAIQNEYFALLSKNLGMSLDELSSLYNIYYHDGISETNQINLDSEDQQFLSQLLQSRSTSKKYTVGEMSISKTK